MLFLLTLLLLQSAYSVTITKQAYLDSLPTRMQSEAPAMEQSGPKPSRQTLVTTTSTNDPFVLIGKAEWHQNSPNNEIGTCKIPNAQYNDWVAFLSPMWMSDSEDNFSCAPYYCIKVVHDDKGVMLQINGRGEVSGMDVQVPKKVLEALGVRSADEIDIKWKPYACDTFPLGPGDGSLPNISFA